MTVYDLGPKAGIFFIDSQLTLMTQDVKRRCWRIFWDNIPEEYHELYLKGYLESIGESSDVNIDEISNPKKEENPFVGCALGCLWIPCSIVIGIVVAGGFFTIMEKIGKWTFFAILFGIIGLFILYIKYICKPEDVTVTEKVKSEYEIFYESMNAEYEKFCSENGGELFKEELVGQFLGVGAGLAVITGHVGLALAAVKAASGHDLTPLNVVSAVSGIGGISELADAADAVDTASAVMDGADVLDSADILQNASDIGDSVAVSHGTLAAGADGDVSSIIGNHSDKVISDVNGSVVASMDVDGTIRDAMQQFAGRFDGNMLFDSNMQLACTIKDNVLFDANNQVMASIVDGTIYDAHHVVVGSISDDGQIFDAMHQFIGKIRS